MQETNVLTYLEDYLTEREKGNTLQLSEYSQHSLDLDTHKYITVDLGIEHRCDLPRGTACALSGVNNVYESRKVIPCALFIQFTYWIEAYGYELANKMLEVELNHEN